MNTLVGSNRVGADHCPIETVSHPAHSNTAWLAVMAMVVSCIILMFAMLRIDFHADEAIYLHNVPINVSNDSGLVFHLGYLGTSFGIPTPISARWTSLLFGMVMIFAVTRTMQVLIPQRSSLMAWLVPLTIVISYQGVFAILRVRPEISWIAVTSVCCWCLAELNYKNRVSFRILLILALIALPMNHMLSWFPCVFLAGHIVMFASRQLGFRMTVGCLAAMACGVILNSSIRSWIVQGDIAWLPSLGSQSVGTRPSLKEFTWNVFWNSPNFLNDTAANGNFWSWILPSRISATMSHCMVATALWACVLPLPLVMNTWRSRYVASIPVLTLGMFYASGYFNPTYTPLLVLYGIYVAIFVAFQLPQQKVLRLVRGYAIAILAISALNGLSFLSTRVFNHGTATFFEMESLLSNEVSKLPEGSVIAVPERFQSIASFRPIHKYTLFKDDLPEKIDLVVLDNYDFEMYRFVPDYDAKRKAIENLLTRCTQTAVLDRQVYKSDSLRRDVSENQSIAAIQGSWFFRNSVNYRVTLLRDETSAPRTANLSSEASNKDSTFR